jgi:hypothetical protein
MSVQIRAAGAEIPHKPPITVFKRVENAAKTVYKDAFKVLHAIEEGTGKAVSHPPTVPLRK